jgi:hypothetical protein
MKKDFISLSFALMVLMVGVLAPANGHATIQLPLNLNSSDRMEALKIIGLSASNKVLTDPYPLGGYAGFEVGFSIENFASSDLAHLGNGIQIPQTDANISRLTFGKGLYNDIDVFVQFTPYFRQDELSQLGGTVRWGFYQAAYLPMNLSVMVYANSGTLANQVSEHSWGTDLVGGITVENVAVFAGIGRVEANGVFASTVTDSSHTEYEYVDGLHTVVGGTVRFSNLFLAIQMDRYKQPVYSGKIGMRF